MEVMASICSEILIMPISAVIAEPALPVIIKAAEYRPEFPDEAQSDCRPK